MTNQEPKPSQEKERRSQEAIRLAMKGEWRKVAEINREILDDFPGDVDALNRFGRACLELDEYDNARAAYQAAIEIDPYNSIARKNLLRLEHITTSRPGQSGEVRKVQPNHFIEDIGKAGVVVLENLGDAEARAKVVAGDTVFLKIKAQSLLLQSEWGETLGEVAPKQAKRLILMTRGGNKYSAAVVSSTDNEMAVIIRETFQAPSQAGRVSFLPKGMADVRPIIADAILKRDKAYEEDNEDESGYMVIGGEEIEVLPGESEDNEDDMNNEEE